jgi:hypothetical protein
MNYIVCVRVLEARYVQLFVLDKLVKELLNRTTKETYVDSNQYPINIKTSKNSCRHQK